MSVALAMPPGRAPNMCASVMMLKSLLCEVKMSISLATNFIVFACESSSLASSLAGRSGVGRGDRLFPGCGR
eukprot:2624607-Heterocapsa_arctica.AAC.1